MMREKLNIEFESDWHIGSGAGIPGSTDRTVLKDAAGLPWIPGKTLTGVLRDAAEWIAATLDKPLPESEKGRWAKALRGLFGDQAESDDPEICRAAVGIGSAAFTPQIAEWLTADPARLASLFIIQPGVSIDPLTGIAKANHLFTLEKVRGGCSLVADVKYLRDLSEDEKALFGYAVKAVRRIGGKRRRGSGLCKLTLAPAPANTSRGELPAASSAQYTELSCKITTRQPVIINKVTLGNVVKSDLVIPGGKILPRIAEIFANALDNQTLQSAILDGRIRVGNFLPELNGKKALPVPLSYARTKNEGYINNLLVQHAPEGIQMKDIRSGYIISDDGKNFTYCSAGAEDSLILRTHNTVEDKYQAPTSNVGGLFTYQAIPAGKEFIGTITVESSLWEKICADLDDDAKGQLSDSVFSIGQSRKDEYGEINFRILNSAPSQPKVGELLDAHDAQHSGEKYLFIYLASSLILRDSFGNYTTDIRVLRDAVAARLGLQLEDASWTEQYSPLGGTRGHCVRTGRSESWQTKWNMARPSFLYFQSGCVFMFRVLDPQNWDPAKAESLQNSGLGDRIAEGFGALLVNPEFLTNRIPDKTVAQPPLSVTAKTSRIELKDIAEPDRPFLEMLQLEQDKAAYRRGIREAVYKSAYYGAKLFLDTNLQWNDPARPTASQFGGLREIAAYAAAHSNGQHAATVGVIRTWLDNKDKSSKNNFSSNYNWSAELKNLCASPDRLWKIADCQRRGTQLDAYAVSTFLDILCEAVFDLEKKSKLEERNAVSKEGK